MKFLAVLVSLSLVVAISGHSLRSKAVTKEKLSGKDHVKKLEQAKMFMGKCLNPATANATMTAGHNNMIVCVKELGNQTGQAFDKANKDEIVIWWRKHDVRIIACVWQKTGFLIVNNDGTASFKADIVAQVAEEFNETAKVTVASKINACFEKKSLSATSTFTMGEDGKGFKPYMECFQESLEAACGKFADEVTATTPSP